MYFLIEIVLAHISIFFSRKLYLLTVGPVNAQEKVIWVPKNLIIGVQQKLPLKI
jgi:hypothetical protein